MKRGGEVKRGWRGRVSGRGGGGLIGKVEGRGIEWERAVEVWGCGGVLLSRLAIVC